MEAKTDTAADLLRLKASEELLLASRRNDKAEIDRALANLDKACEKKTTPKPTRPKEATMAEDPVKEVINEMADELDWFFRNTEPTREESMDRVRTLVERANISLQKISEERKRQGDLFHPEEQLTIEGS
ncbi:hypothetical protein M1432_01425 [Patescibacteria group bacterium]|nr:hypothetical protein [Patescibacteria group bacterium]